MSTGRLDDDTAIAARAFIAKVSGSYDLAGRFSLAVAPGATIGRTAMPTSPYCCMGAGATSQTPSSPWQTRPTRYCWKPGHSSSRSRCGKTNGGIPKPIKIPLCSATSAATECVCESG